MDDVDQMEWNEYQRLERALDARRKRIEALERGAPLIRQRNFRYVVDFTFDYTEMAGPVRGALQAFDVAPPAPQSRSFIVKSESEDQKKTHFYVKNLEASYALFASQAAEQPGPGQRFFIGPDYRRNFFDFTWRLRDTGSDREWQNTALPSQLLMNGNVNPLLFGNGHCLLSGGTEVIVEVTPTFSGNLLLRSVGEQATPAPLTALKSHFLQICFVGVEVIL